MFKLQFEESSSCCRKLLKSNLKGIFSFNGSYIFVVTINHDTVSLVTVDMAGPYLEKVL